MHFERITHDWRLLQDNGSDMTKSERHDLLKTIIEGLKPFEDAVHRFMAGLDAYDTHRLEANLNELNAMVSETRNFVCGQKMS